MRIHTAIVLTLIFLSLNASVVGSDDGVVLSHGIDESAGGVSTYIVTTPLATYYLEKEGGGLSSMLDKDGIDWLGFNNEPGTGWKGEYRGFPNAIHKQDGNYFHAMNSGTDPSVSTVDIEQAEHLRITFTSENSQWQGQWDFYPDRCDFTLSRVSEGYKYWIQYEGVPGGEMDPDDFWYSSANGQRNLIDVPFEGDLPSPEWMAFGDAQSSRMLYMLHHQDDEHPDDYSSRPYMTVFAFGRRGKNKYLDKVQSFSIGFVESTEYVKLQQSIEQILK